MITLHSVSKSVGRGRMRRLILDDLTWTVQPRQHYVVLGQQGAGKSTLLNIMSGSRLPNRGWVERKGIVCPGRTLARVGAPDITPRQLSKQLACLYHVPPQEVVAFLPRFANLEDAMDIPIKMLPNRMVQRLNYALIYAIPFDVYLFDDDIGPRRDAFATACRQAFEQRCKNAVAIVTTSRPNIAREFEGVGCILHDGKLHCFETVSEAVAAFQKLPRPEPKQSFLEDAAGTEEDDQGEWA